MGSALSTKVDQLLRDIVKIDRSSANVGLGTSAYHGTRARLLPRDIGNGLMLSGDAASIKVSTQTLGAVGALFGSAPPVRVEVRGVRLVIQPDDGATRGAAPKTTNTGDIEKHLAKLEVEVFDVALEIRLGGCIIRAQIDRLTALPKPTPLPSGNLAWRVHHTELQVDVAGQRAASAGGAHVEVVLGPRSSSGSASSATAAAARGSIWSAAVSVEAKLRAQLDLGQLLAILDLAAAAQALSGASAAVAVEDPTGRSSGNQWSVKFPETSAQVDMAGEPLLEIKCQRGSASGSAAVAGRAGLDQGVVEVQAEHLWVRSGGEAGRWAISPRARVRCEAKGETRAGAGAAVSEDGLSLDLGFPSSDTLPWQGPLELLVADPSFAPHRAWLEAVRDAAGAGKGRKRPRDEVQDITDDEGRRIRRARL